MAQQKKKVVATTGMGKKAGTRTRTRPRRAEGREPVVFPFQKVNFRFMLIGLAVVAFGMILMLGGRQSDPGVWEPEVIYSWRRLVLAPVVILLGLLVEVYAIFASGDDRRE